jgi:energy-coupling factor transport system substrate-specific component
MSSTAPEQSDRWRTVDIVVAAVIAVAFGALFQAWNAVWVWTEPIFRFFWPAQALLYGVWLMPAVLAALVVRRRGAAFFGGFVAAAVSLLLGSPYGLDSLLSGAVQGAGAELVFAFALYRSWGLPAALLAGAASGIGAWLHDVPIYYPKVEIGLQLAYGAFILLSGAIVAGAGAWILTRALAETGVLAPFASGRRQRPV